MRRNNLALKLKGVTLVWLLTSLFIYCTGREGQDDRSEALQFLYENMPLPDSVDHPVEYWEHQVDLALEARREMPWGKKIPDREWRHFVLPVRVNNEDLDNARDTFYHALKARVQHMNMYDAALEVNHWCHEHVTYQPSDSRTRSPLQTMRAAIGRCGEESTFTVAALRAVGIPARQVYTPRWAHTDDNHAWVEVWVDGRWYYMGACEPESRLNVAWFSEASTRGMLMHTKVFGAWEDSAQVINRNACYTELNVTSHYAEMSNLTVQVTDLEGEVVPHAQVAYCIYNYAEFYPLASFETDEKGQASLTLGKGDVLVWASHGDRFGFEKVSVDSTQFVKLALQYDQDTDLHLQFDIKAPKGKKDNPGLSESEIIQNRALLNAEDSLRAAYMKRAFAPEGSDSLLIHSRANHLVIGQFLKTHAEKARTLLSQVSLKDLGDVTAETLEDHLTHTLPQPTQPLWAEYVLSPRIANELLTPWRKTLAERFSGMKAKEIVRWVNDSIRVDNSRNPQRLCMSPLGVFRHRVTDDHSITIFCVAALRSAGFPARLNPVTGQTEWASPEGDWNRVNYAFEKAVQADHVQGELALQYVFNGYKHDPMYYTHFTLSALHEGRPSLLSFSEDATWSHPFSKGITLETGQKMLVSGTRLADGGVLADLRIFHVKEGGRTNVPLVLRTTEKDLQVIGNFDCELGYTNVRGIHKSLLQTTGRGFYIVGLIRANHEPSVHALRDFERSNIYLSQWPHCFLLLFPNEEEYSQFRRKDYDGLPSNFIFGIADPETVEAIHIPELTQGSRELPIFMLCDTFGHVFWQSQGYTIGLDEQVMEVIRRLM